MNKKNTRMLRPEQKCLSLLQELVSRFSNPEDIVVDGFSGTFSTAIACFTVEEGHRRFVGCEIDTNCFKWARERVIKRFAAAVVNKETDIKVSGDALISAHGIVARQSAKSRTRLPKWSPPDGLPKFQTFPVHILGQLSCTINDIKLSAKCRNLPLHHWPRHYQAFIEIEQSELLLKIDAAANSLMLTNSTIKHSKAGRGVFANKTFHQGDTICAFYGTLVYHDISARQARKKCYGVGMRRSLSITTIPSFTNSSIPKVNHEYP